MEYRAFGFFVKKRGTGADRSFRSVMVGKAPDLIALTRAKPVGRLAAEDRTKIIGSLFFLENGLVMGHQAIGGASRGKARTYCVDGIRGELGALARVSGQLAQRIRKGREAFHH